MDKEGFAAPVFDYARAYPVWSLPCDCARYLDAGGNYREELCSFGSRLNRLVEVAWARHFNSRGDDIGRARFELYEQRADSRDAHTKGLYDSVWTPATGPFARFEVHPPLLRANDV